MVQALLARALQKHVGRYLPAMMVVLVTTLVFFACTAADAAVYEVGPGKEHGAIGEVPWESLQPGDSVRIYWREAPYKEKWVICRRGAAEAPITVTGVPGPGGELPVIDGRDATTRAELDYWNEERSIIKIGGANKPADTTPAYIIIENLDIRSARAPYSFTGRNGRTDYQEQATAINIEKGEHITIRNCVMHDCGNGFFGGGQDTLVERCHLYDNGIEGSIYHHQSYTAADGIIFQYNHYGPLREGCKGNNLKDRSAGLVVRYNWIESGDRQLDLVDAEDNEGRLAAVEGYHETFVYGNVLIETEGSGNNQIVHYGGDSGHKEWYRKGTLHFYNNTVISTRSGNTTLFALSTNDEHVDARNNIIYVTAPGNRLALLSARGRLTLSHNWAKPGWRTSFEGSFEGEVNDDGTSITGDAPGFADFKAQDFYLAEGSPCTDAGTEPHDDAARRHAPEMEYVRHQKTKSRIDPAPADLGAFAFPLGQAVEEF